MKQTVLEITLRQPLIISQQAASAGAHQSLDFIPGSALLGLVASRLYGSLEPDQAFTVFHSGKVRFGDGLPVCGGEVAYPVPLSWHTWKGEKADDNGVFQSEQVFDPSNATDRLPQGRQPKQMREGYVTMSGRKVNPAKIQTLKTAIDPSVGMAAESQLFGYEALDAGQTFRAVISADNELDDALWRQVCNALQGEGRLGRSRSAQFGLVTLKNLAASAANLPVASPVAGQVLTLWLLSDLSLSWRGQPCLTPEPSLLGLPEGSEWLAAQSFIRTRKYSPWNAFRQHYDPERQVICRGSVLRYRLSDAKTVDLTGLAVPFGRNREGGLGWAWVNPPLLAATHPVFAKPPISKSIAKSMTRPDTLLIRALSARAGMNTSGTGAGQLAASLFEQMLTKIRQARQYEALPVGVAPEKVPGRSQFGRLKELASNLRQDKDALWNALSNSTDGMLSRNRSGWELSFGPQQDQKLGIWLHSELEKLRLDERFPAIIGQLAMLGLTDDWTNCIEGKDIGGIAA